MAEIKKVKISELPVITDLSGYMAFGVKVNEDNTVDNALAPLALFVALTPNVTFSINEAGELVYDITYE